jgi:hypothetical protein
MKTKLSAEEWQKIGDQAKQVREELFTLIRLSSGNLPMEVMHHLPKAIDHLDIFRSKAEDRMLSSSASENLSVFYGK